jgi:hypothetical protein
MSVLLLNGESIAATFDPGLPVGEIVKRHLDVLLPEGEIVCQVEVDGADEQVDGLCWGEFAELNVLTSHPTTLVVEGLGSSGEVMASVRLNLARAAEHLRTGDKPGFANVFVQAIDDLLSVLRFIGLAVAHMGARAQLLVDYQVELEQLLGQLASAQQADDMVLMADLLVFELGPKLECWDEIRLELTSELDTGHQQSS